jgi:hypothetical protein
MFHRVWKRLYQKHQVAKTNNSEAVVRYQHFFWWAKHWCARQIDRNSAESVMVLKDEAFGGVDGLLTT